MYTHMYMDAHECLCDSAFPSPHNTKEGQQDIALVLLSAQELMMLYKMQPQPYAIELQTVPKTEEIRHNLSYLEHFVT